MTAGTTRSKSRGKCLLASIALAGTWLLALPCRAQTSLQVCDGYPVEMSDQELSDASLKLKYNMPASSVMAFQRIAIENSDAVGPVAPYISPTGKKSWTISVPKGFRRLQCRLLQYQFYKINGHITPPPEVNKLIVACARSVGPAKCFDQFVVKPASDLEKAYPYNASNAALLRQLVDTAFENVMMHEAAHVILADESKNRDLGSATELQADLFALAGTMGAGSPQMGAIATPAMMSLMDGLTESSEESHPAAACRAANNDAIVREIGPQIGALFQWLIDPEQYPKTRSMPPSLNLQVWIPGNRTRCAPINSTYTTAVRADLDGLLTILDSIGIISPDEIARWEQQEKLRIWSDTFLGSMAQMTLGKGGQRGSVDTHREEWERHPAQRQFNRTLEKLLGFEARTAEAQRFRAKITSLWIGRWVVDERKLVPSENAIFNAMLSPELRAVARESEQRIQMLAKLDILDRSWAVLTRYDIASEDYGSLLGLRAMFSYLASPPGSSIKKNATRLLKSLDEANLYYSGSTLALYQRGLAALLTGQCSLARDHLKSARPLLDSPDPGQLATIDFIISSDDAGCARINEGLREQLKRDLRWID